MPQDQPPPAASPYDDVRVHLKMLRDDVRTTSYQRAIQAVVKPADRVLDFGCGTGVLAIFAARAGAKRVYAVDRSRMIRAARRIAGRNDAGCIRFFHDDGESLELPVEKVDVLISEWMGHFVFAESMLAPLLHVRDRFLAQGGRMLPERISLHAALVVAPSPFEEQAFLSSRPYDIDFSTIADWPLYEVEHRRFEAGEIGSESVQIGELRMPTITAPPDRFGGSLICPEPATVYGVCTWFDAHLTEDISFSTGPRAAPTHWRQAHFPLPRPWSVRAGETVSIRLRILDQLEGATAWRWSLRCGDRQQDSDNIVHKGWIARPLPRGELTG